MKFLLKYICFFLLILLISCNNPTLANNNTPINNSHIGVGLCHSVFLKSDTTIWSTGDNSSGQLGGGTTKNSSTPIQMKDSNGNFINNVASVATGRYYTVFLKSDGSIWSVGNNFYGQLGNETTENSNTPIQMKDSNGKPITDVTNIFAKSGHSIFIKSDGSVWITGEHFNRGNSNILNPKEIFDSNGETIKNVINVATGSYHIIFLRSDGSIWGIGDNSHGQLGLGYDNEITSLVQLKDSMGKPITGVTGIAAGDECTFILKSDNSIWSTGNNYYGQLGYYSDKPELTFKEMYASNENAITSISGIVSGKNHTIFSKSDGTIWASGNNTDGQLGNNVLNEFNDSPIQIIF